MRGLEVRDLAETRTKVRGGIEGVFSTVLGLGGFCVERGFTRRSIELYAETLGGFSKWSHQPVCWFTELRRQPMLDVIFENEIDRSKWKVARPQLFLRLRWIFENLLLAFL